MNWEIFFQIMALLIFFALLLWSRKKLSTLLSGKHEHLKPKTTLKIIERTFGFVMLALTVIFSIHSSILAEHEDIPSSSWLNLNDVLQYPLQQDSILNGKQAPFDLTQSRGIAHIPKKKNGKLKPNYLFIIDRTASGKDNPNSQHVEILKKMLDDEMKSNKLNLNAKSHDSIPLKDLFVLAMVQQMPLMKLKDSRCTFMNYYGNDIIKSIFETSKKIEGAKDARKTIAEYIDSVRTLDKRYSSVQTQKTNLTIVLDTIQSPKFEADSSIIFILSDFEHEAEQNEIRKSQLTAQLYNSYSAKRGNNIVLLQFPGKNQKPELAKSTLETIKEHGPVSRLLVYDQDFFIEKNDIQTQLQNLLKPIQLEPDTLNLYNTEKAGVCSGKIKAKPDDVYYFRIVRRDYTSPDAGAQISLNFPDAEKNTETYNSFRKPIKFKAGESFTIELSSRESSEHYLLEVMNQSENVIKRIPIVRHNHLSNVASELHIIGYSCIILLLIFETVILFYESVMVAVLKKRWLLVVIFSVISIFVLVFLWSSIVPIMTTALSKPTVTSILSAISIFFILFFLLEVQVLNKYLAEKTNKTSESNSSEG